MQINEAVFNMQDTKLYLSTDDYGNDDAFCMGLIKKHSIAVNKECGLLVPIEDQDNWEVSGDDKDLTSFYTWDKNLNRAVLLTYLKINGVEL